MNENKSFHSICILDMYSTLKYRKIEICGVLGMISFLQTLMSRPATGSASRPSLQLSEASHQLQRQCAPARTIGAPSRAPTDSIGASIQGMKQNLFLRDRPENHHRQFAISPYLSKADQIFSATEQSVLWGPLPVGLGTARRGSTF